MSLDAIFKSYDVRGLVPEELNEDVARRIGSAFAAYAAAPRIAVGWDCRQSSPDIAAALVEGITSQGVSVDDLGMITTDMVYYASGAFDEPGAMVTASHNPKGYNGIKLCLAGAAPVGADTGLDKVKLLARDAMPAEATAGTVRPKAILDEYVSHVVSVVEPAAISTLRVAVDGGNGVAGVAIPAVFDTLAAELIGLYLEPDGTFPNHHPDPLRPENLRDLEALMKREHPDLGVAFDGDADRAFFVDDRLRPLAGSTVASIIAAWFLDREPGAAIVHNLICSRALPEMVVARGGSPIRTRVGHSFIKQVMADTGAVFGGEHSGHYYFRENFRADSGILAMLVLLRVLSEDGRPLSVLRLEHERYAQSGEINFSVGDKAETIDAVEHAFAEASTDRLDGLTVDLGDRWFNVRPSNTEPVLRLNAEAPSAQDVDDLVASARSIIEEER